MIKGILSMLLTLLAISSYAQPKTGRQLIDSLITELHTGKPAKPDSVKANILASLCFEYCNSDPDTGILYGKECLELAQAQHLKNQAARVFNYLGACYCVKGDYPTALDNLMKALELNEELGNKKRTAGTSKNIGRIYVQEKDTANALKYYNYALSVYREIKDTTEIPTVWGDIGSAYEAAKNYPVALEYYHKALEKNRLYNNAVDIALNVSNIGVVLSEQGNYPDALKNSFEALRLNEALEDKSNALFNMGVIGECYLAIARDTAGKFKAGDLIPAGKAANLRLAICYLDSSMALCREVGDVNSEVDFNKDLSEAQEMMGNYKSALEYYKQFVAAKDSVFNIDNNTKIANLETKRELEVKDKQIQIDKLEVAKKRNERMYYLSGIFVLLLVIGFVFRSNRLLDKEKKRSDGLLRNILPAEVADELKNTGRSAAKNFDNVTIMFTDFVNFTEAAERMSPQGLIDELHACFQAFDTITDKYNIEKIKTIGDGYLAVAGLPIADPSHAGHIVSAATEISKFMAERHAAPGANTFEVRIGIHSGSVVAGIVGVKKFAYDIWGDAVNIAARMEQYCDPGRINLSEATRQLVKDKFSLEYRGEIEVKNKGPMKMYYVAPNP